jgi:hypothetical protein
MIDPGGGYGPPARLEAKAVPTATVGFPKEIREAGARPKPQLRAIP